MNSAIHIQSYKCQPGPTASETALHDQLFQISLIIYTIRKLSEVKCQNGVGT